jgi:hypothetical protein
MLRARPRSAAVRAAAADAAELPQAAAAAGLPLGALLAAAAGGGVAAAATAAAAAAAAGSGSGGLLCGGALAAQVVHARVLGDRQGLNHGLRRALLQRGAHRVECDAQLRRLAHAARDAAHAVAVAAQQRGHDREQHHKRDEVDVRRQLQRAALPRRGVVRVVAVGALRARVRWRRWRWRRWRWRWR